MGIEHEFQCYGGVSIQSLRRAVLHNAVQHVLRHIDDTPRAALFAVFCTDWQEWFDDAVVERRCTRTYPVEPGAFTSVAAVVHEAQQRAAFRCVEATNVTGD